MKLMEVVKIRRATDAQILSQFNRAVKRRVKAGTPIQSSMQEFLQAHKATMADVKRTVRDFYKSTVDEYVRKAWEDEQYQQIFRAEQKIDDGHAVADNQFFTVDDSKSDAARVVGRPNPYG